MSSGKKNNVPEKRIGRTERDEAITTLRRHLEAERITLAEFEERMSAAMEARTGSELRRLFADLPKLSSSPAERKVSSPRPRARQKQRIDMLWFWVLFWLIMASAVFSSVFLRVIQHG